MVPTISYSIFESGKQLAPLQCDKRALPIDSKRMIWRALKLLFRNYRVQPWDCKSSKKISPSSLKQGIQWPAIECLLRQSEPGFHDASGERRLPTGFQSAGSSSAVLMISAQRGIILLTEARIL
jgi:hypothetical protein